MKESESRLAQAASDIKDALSSIGLRPDILVVPGDLTSRGSPNEFRLTSRFIELVAKEVGIPADRVLITYGNHDVDWKVCRIANTAGPVRDAYRKLAARVGDLFASGTPPSVEGPVRGSGLFRLGGIELLMLNSGIECYALEKEEDPYTDYPHGKIGPEQLQWLQQLPAPTEDGVARVAVLHHHLLNIPFPVPIADISTLQEGAEVRSEFGRLGVDVIVHGHRHHPHLVTTVETGWKKPVATLCAGSYGVDPHHRSNGCIPNTFHVVEILQPGPSGNRCGVVHSFKQEADETWSLLAGHEKSVALDAQQWFGVPMGTTELKDGIVALLTPLAAEAKKTGWRDLPLHKELPLGVRCQRAKTLNEAVMQAASDLGCRVTGKYPDQCSLSPRP